MPGSRSYSSCSCRRSPCSTQFLSICLAAALSALSLLLLSQALLCGGPPPTRTDNVTELLHGVEVVDPYRWLEDQAGAETRSWIDAQNDYTKAILSTLPGRDSLEQELTDLMRVDVVRTPLEASGRYFFEKRRADEDLYVICMRQRLDGPEEVLIDPHPLSPDHTTSVDLLAASKDGKMVAYGVRNGGEDEVTIKLYDVDGRRDLPDVLPRADYFDVVITPDKAGLYYSKHSDRGPLVLYHAVGSDPASDVEIFGRGYGPDMMISANLSDDGQWMVFTVYYGSASKTEIYYCKVSEREIIRPLIRGIDAEFTPTLGGDHLFLQTDWKAPKGRIIEIDFSGGTPGYWTDVVPETEDVIKDMSPVGGKLFVTYVRDVVPVVKVFEPDGKPLRTLDLPSMGYVGHIGGRWESDDAFFYFSSYHIPPRIYRHGIRSGEQETWWQSMVPVESDLFDVRQVWYKSGDGTRVPMFVASRKGVTLDGSNPTLLEGYGGFRSIGMPYFSARVAVWIKHGGIYAHPSLRGGSEFGEEWHKAGMLDRKQNTFDDFIAAAEYLIAEGYTNPQKLSISGGSNGGLLVGAAMTQRPDLFQAVVCWHPLLDMIRYHRFLVASFWVPEYGSSDDPDQFNYIYAYSPYHRVVDGVAYPGVLMISGDADTRVDPLHARKMVARLQAATSSERPILLQYDTKAGHMGGKPLTRIIEDDADELRFLMWQLGMTQ